MPFTFIGDEEKSQSRVQQRPKPTRLYTAEEEKGVEKRIRPQSRPLPPLPHEPSFRRTSYYRSRSRPAERQNGSRAPSRSRARSVGNRVSRFVSDAEKLALASLPNVAPGLRPYSQAAPSMADAYSVMSRRTEAKPRMADDNSDPFAHLPQHHAAVLKEQLDIPPTKVSYFTLYRYATPKDLLVISIATIASIAAGALLPLMTVVFGNLSQVFRDKYIGLISDADYNHTLSLYSSYFVLLGVAQFFLLIVGNAGFMYTGTNITNKTRANFLAAVLRQNIGFFDKVGAGEITTRITNDTNLIQDAISEKVSLVISCLATFFSAFIIAYVRFWKLALILSSVIVAIVLTMGSAANFLMRWTKASTDEYGKGGTLAEEVLSSIRNATAFGAQKKLLNQYNQFLTRGSKPGIKAKGLTGILLGILYMFIYLNYGLAFYAGTKFYISGEIDLAKLLTIQMVILLGAFSLGMMASALPSVGTGIAAGTKIFQTIDRVSPLDPYDPNGIKLEYVHGHIELKKIRHIYPSRPEVTVMKNVSLFIPAGRTTALVGASGCGKSTIIGLVERFYKPVSGQVLLDGHDISTLNLRWLRQQIALVSQEPTLFATTIFKNIEFGLIGTRYEGAPDQTIRQLVENAARTANAHDFICGLDAGYETQVGDRGFLLSGGQKQRIAIARAIVSDPKILLLDEATSALDTKSEGVVQEALDRAAEGRTTIVIAHRLSTIKNAHNIVVMNRGKIIEQGNHQELLEQKGSYYTLVEAQKIKARQEARQSEMFDLSAHDKLDFVETASTWSDRTYAYDKMKLDEPSIRDSIDTMPVPVLKVPAPEITRQYSLWALIKFLAQFNRKEWGLMGFAFFWSMITGGAEIVAAVCFSKSIDALSIPLAYTTPEAITSSANFWALMYLMLGCTLFVAYSISGVIFAYCSEKLVHRLREACFRLLLRQDMSFFDNEKNTAGALSAFLSTETTHAAGISGQTLGYLIATLTTLASSSIVGLAVGWKLSLVCIATIPVLLGCGFMRLYVLLKHARITKESYERSAAHACEAASAIRTVASLTRERDVIELYSKQINAQKSRSYIPILKSSAYFSASQALIFACIALGFWYGGTLIGSKEYNLFQFFLCFTAIIFGAQAAGSIFSLAPDMGKSKVAAAAIKTLFDRMPAIDIWSDNGNAMKRQTAGSIDFINVHFRYPTRLETPVLRGVTLSVKPGQYVALVGPSGCGKSTSIALLERFYDPMAGGVFLDRRDIRQYNLNEYRSRIALVSQEPTLYQGTVRENICLGAAEGEVFSDAQVEKACRAANIYDFVMSLPHGMNTLVGAKGALLSGGQKQRIAIARALLRDPTVLLLDEATSALDSESEKVVQEALDKAAKGRTTIAVAHRLSTIQHADVIYVFDQGRIAEAGTHDELMRRKGKYCELVNLQSLG